MNMDTQIKHREQISALADGQLADGEWAIALECAAEEADGRESWHAYHVIGDVLRSPDLGACGHDRAFVARLRTRLLAEAEGISSTVALKENPELIANYDPSTLGLAQKFQENERRAPSAANDSNFRWKLLASAASFAAVMAVGWNVMSHLDDAASGARLAQSSSAPARITGVSSAVAVGEPGATTSGAMVMVRDPRLDELLAAHRQFGGTSALQNPSGFLRNATFEGGAR